MNTGKQTEHILSVFVCSLDQKIYQQHVAKPLCHLCTVVFK